VLEVDAPEVAVAVRSRPSRTTRLVIPRATPVSSTLSGRRCETRHQMASLIAGSASFQPPYVARPTLSPAAASVPTVSVQSD
jgi:hypothetical protein